MKHRVIFGLAIVSFHPTLSFCRPVSTRLTFENNVLHFTCYVFNSQALVSMGRLLEPWFALSVGEDQNQLVPVVFNAG